ncbi:MAG: glycosyltransferase [Ktedonobacterales bacterium]
MRERDLFPDISELDERFWREMRSGCVALRHGDVWAAQLRIEALVREVVLPLAIQLWNLSATDEGPRGAASLRVEEKVARWQAGPSAMQTLSAYAALVEDYCALRHQVGIQNANQRALEEDILAHIDQALHQQMEAHAEVLTWRHLSIVLPAYNEEAIIANTVQACLLTAERLCPNAEIVVVNDGSRDRTGAIIDDLAARDARVVAIHHTVNRGYGAAILSGFAAARGELLFFMDSDGQFDIEDIARLIPIQERDPAVAVLGYRERRQDTWVRRANAWSWKQMVRLVLGLRGVRDIDCAFKLLPTRVVRACAITAQGAMVNTELLVKLQRMGVAWVQVPVRHFPRTHGTATGANLRVIARAFRELLQTRLRIHAWQPPSDVSGQVSARLPHPEHASAGSAAATDVQGAQAPERVLRHIPAGARRLTRGLAARAKPEWGITALAAALSIGFYAWYASQGLVFAYGDAVSHLMIARWVFASRTPGLAQLGTVWLPLHHVLMLPLVWNDTLWRDGLAGSLPSMLAYVVGTVYMYRLGRLMFDSGRAGVVASAVYMLNPSLLYMQATAMSESDLLCLATVAVFYCARWTRSYRASDLVKSAAMVAAATLIRYEAWALVVALALIVGYVAWRRHGWASAEAQLILFGTLAFAGCASWFLYNQVIFGSALAFQNGSYSPSVAQQSLETSYGLVTSHNAWLSLGVYGQAAIDSVQWPIAGLALLALVGCLYRFGVRPEVLPIYALLAPLAFDWLSLVSGNTVLFTPEFKSGAPHFYFNERYGMTLIPAAALLLAYWAVRRRAMMVCALGIVLLFGGLNPALATPYALQDPLNGVTAQGRTLAPEEGHWLAAAYHGGNVLISGGPFEAAIFYSGLPGRAFVTDGNGAEFQAALAHPETSVTWIVMNPNGGNFDPVWNSLHQRQDWRAYFVLRKTIDSAQFYERIGSDSK